MNLQSIKINGVERQYPLKKILFIYGCVGIKSLMHANKL